MLAAVVSALGLLLRGSPEAEIAAMTPREKAAAVVVAGMPAGPGFGGVLVRPWNATLPRPAGSIVFADQEGGLVKTFAGAGAVAGGVRATASAAEAFARRARDGGWRCGVRAPTRPSRRCSTWRTGRSARGSSRGPEYGVAFARGLGRAACVKHFPGLGSTAAVDRRGARLRRAAERRISHRSGPRFAPACRA